MANFYFFTDIDLLSNQALIGAFGPAGSSGGKDKYQVTSIHSSTTDSNAYAVSDGVVFVQEDGSNANLVNLILKPLSQPPFAFPKIKFIIYRGIKKDSLFNGSEIAVSTSNDLTKSIWDSQALKNASTGTSENPPVGALGIDLKAPTFPDSSSIDDIFYRDNVANQFPVVRSGWKIGKFNAASFGIEILTESIGFDPKLSIARANKNIIEVDSLPGSPTQPQMFEHWHDKEEVLNYIDPCAFFGCFFKSKLKVRKSTNNNVDKMSGNDLYDSVITKFYNKNTVYLDIRNEYNYSFNYFKNYGTNIQIAYDSSSALSSINYYNSGWPIFAINNSSFPNSNTSNDRNRIRISMPDGSGDNPLPMMYISVGYLENTYPRAPKDKNKMIDLSVVSGNTEEIGIASFNRKGLTNTTSVSSYIKLKYFKRFDPEATTPPVSSGTVIRAGNFMDHLFAPYSMRIPFHQNNGLKILVFDEEAYVDVRAELNMDFISKIGRSLDEVNHTFFALPEIERNDGKVFKIPFTISSGVDSLNDNFYSFLASRMKNRRVKKTLFKINPKDVVYADLVEEETVVSENFNEASTNGIFAISISSNEFSSIVNSSFDTHYRIYFGFKNKQTLTDQLGKAFTTFDLTLRGFVTNSSSVQFQEIITNLKIYFNGNIG